MRDGPSAGYWRASRPWLLLLAVAGVAVWHDLDFREFVDHDFPRVVRPFFSSHPPAAYRLAEPGDTLDRVGLYFAAGSVALALSGLISQARANRDLALWPSALALGLAATWHASTPGPTFDGWHGLGWRTIGDPAAPIALRVALAASALGLAGVIAVNVRRVWGRRPEILSPPLYGLLTVAGLLVMLRQFEIPGSEPVGYWPRCSFDIGMLAFALALARARPFEGVRRGRLRASLTWAVLVALGIGLTIYHRPLARLRAVVPGRIYIGAMPGPIGLAIEQKRLHFRTIINLFDEASSEASPGHEDEIRFVREHGLRYLGSPSDGLESDRFLDETLALAQDPEAWPILVHCHGCMDRSPAWMGLYRFLVEGAPLDSIFREIERHRGSRPKAIVSLQYNRKLPVRAPERFAADPTAQALRRSVSGTKDPFDRPNWNMTRTGRKVVIRIDPAPRTRDR